MVAMIAQFVLPALFAASGLFALATLALSWRHYGREFAAIRAQLTTGPHTPGSFRTTVVRNLDAWYTAFGVKPGQKLYLPPAERISFAWLWIPGFLFAVVVPLLVCAHTPNRRSVHQMTVWSLSEDSSSKNIDI